MRPFQQAVLAMAVVLVVPACYDLNVTDPNTTDSADVWADADLAESNAAGAFKIWYQTTYAYHGAGLMLSVAAFQHISPWSCGGPTYSNLLPRREVDLTGSYCNESSSTWYGMYEALNAVLLGLRALDVESVRENLGPARAARLRAYGRFMQGLTLGNLALLYDRAAIPREDTDLTKPLPLVGYDTVMSVALDYLDEAASLSNNADWPAIPAEWMSVAVAPAELARLAHSFAARFRASVARTPAERAAVDWTRVRADVDAGITSSWLLAMDWTGWYNSVIDIGTAPDWGAVPYFIVGLADQSGNVRRWLDIPVFDRIPAPDTDGDGEPDPILVVTPDTRFPQGTTVAEQTANPGSIYAIPCEEGPDAPAACAQTGWPIQDLWAQPQRGTWRWSYYAQVDTRAYVLGLDFHWPEIRVAEMRLLKAEAMLRQGDAGEAAALVNVSRTANGLAPTDAAGTNTDCVPRMVDGRCGDLMEMLKWEKRLETHFAGLFGAPWYFDGRGWGDLYRGTFLELPVPCDELTVLNQLPCYTFGGAEDMASPGSVYHWPDEAYCYLGHTCQP